MFQKRHYEFIADTLKELQGQISADDHQNVVEHFATKLYTTNARFDRDWET